MKLAVLDAATLGEDIDITPLRRFGEVAVYPTTSEDELAERLGGVDIAIVNKVKMTAKAMRTSDTLRLICVAATGYDCIDMDYCREAGIGVCNVVGYSTDSVAQTTVSIALYLANHLPEYTKSVRDGSYTKGGVATRIMPVYRELAGKVWGIAGYGNIGSRVGAVAKALGCRVIAYKKTKIEGVECVDFDTLCTESDILSVHLPLTAETRGIFSESAISKMKRDCIFINVARGAETDEAALAKAIKEGRLGGLGADVYTAEPFGEEHPFYEIKELSNVCLTPHMAWGAYEARVRCLDDIILSIDAYINGKKRSRVD